MQSRMTKRVNERTRVCVCRLDGACWNWPWGWFKRWFCSLIWGFSCRNMRTGAPINPQRAPVEVRSRDLCTLRPAVHLRPSCDSVLLCIWVISCCCYLRTLIKMSAVGHIYPITERHTSISTSSLSDWTLAYHVPAHVFKHQTLLRVILLFPCGSSACSACRWVRRGWRGFLNTVWAAASTTKGARPCSCVVVHMMQFKFCSPEIIYRRVWAWLLFSISHRGTVPPISSETNTTQLYINI